jgi:isopenicillin-N epimerase
VQHVLEPLVVSWGWNRDEVGRVSIPGDEEAGMESRPTSLLDLGTSTSRFIEENERQGTRDPAAYLSVPAAIQFQAEHDWSRVREECHELLREARRRIEALTGLPPICPDSTEWYAQMAAFPLPECDGAALQRRLYEEHRVEVPVIEWNGRRLVRVSVQGYNTAEDIEALICALRAVLPV